MLEEFDDGTVSTIAKLGAEAAGEKKVSILELPGERNQFALVRSDGSYEILSKDFDLRSSALCSVDQIGLFAIHARDEWGMRPAIYYNGEGGVVRICDGNLPQRPEQAKWNAVHTESWLLLNKWHNSPKDAFLSHRDFIRTLRIQIGDCFQDGEVDALSRQLAQLDFLEGGKVSSTVTRSRESMGKEIAAEVRSSTGEIPEELLLEVKIYRGPVLLKRHAIRCSFEVDVNNGRLAIIPFAGELENAFDAEMVGLGDLLRTSVRSSPRLADSTDPESQPTDYQWQIPVFYGRP